MNNLLKVADVIDFHCLRIVLMDEVLGQGPSSAPPVLTASIPEDKPGPSDQEEEDEDDEEEESQLGLRRREGEGGFSLLQRTILTLFLLLFS